MSKTWGNEVNRVTPCKGNSDSLLPPLQGEDYNVTPTQSDTLG